MEFVHVEIKFDVGEPGHMQIVAQAPITGFHPDYAKAEGFTRSEDGWSREVTDEIIERTIAQAQWYDPLSPISVPRHVTGWRRK